MNSRVHTWNLHPAVTTPSRWALGVLFVIAGLAKLGNPAQLALDTANFRLLPAGAENLVAIVLPWIELTAGAALLSGARARAAAWLVTALMVVFTLAVAAAMARGLNITCGCFGTLDAPRVGALKLADNGAILALCAVACRRRA